jgi:uncharacterized protein (TIGR00730 family)
MSNHNCGAERDPAFDERARLEKVLASPSYRLAHEDLDLLNLPALRPVRMQLELLKPEMFLTRHGVRSTIVVYGGTSIVAREVAQARLEQARAALAAAPQGERERRDLARAEAVLAKCHFYDEAREFARIVSAECKDHDPCDYVIVTGGGPGIMEAANRGAHDVDAKSVGLNITLPLEQQPNSYITPELCFQFRYFALRKMHFVMRAKALVIFPGGFGTLDELFEVLTLRQTQRMQEIPIIMYCRRYWDGILNLKRLADEGVIADEHLNLVQYVETPQEAWETILAFHLERGNE